VVDALFDAAVDWCRKRGLTRLVGPKGFTVFEGYGVLIDGFDQLPAMGVPYNYAYYGPRIEALGFEKEVDFTSYYVRITDFQMPERISRLASRVRERRGLHVRQFKSMPEVRAAVSEIVDTYNSVFVENWEYVPVTPEEGRSVAKQMLQVTTPEMIKIIANEEDQIVGFLTTFVNVGRALQKCRGRLFPLGWYHLLRELKTSEYVDINGMGILEEYRGLGGNIIMYDELYKSVALPGRFVHGDMTQMADFVVRMLSDANTLGGEPYKVHRVYRKQLE
jgi:hypothetical protein